MKLLLLLSCVVVLTRAVRDKSLQEEWYDFKYQYNKAYASDAEEQFRMKVFAKHKCRIDLHNQRFVNGELTYSLGLNKYSDMTHQEFIDTMFGFDVKYATENDTIRGSKFIPPARVSAPNSLDWRNKGAVTGVKDQGHCGSCWAFSANLMDCSHLEGNKGCRGGHSYRALEYVKENGGIDTEESYPYRAMDSTTCRYNPKNSGATVADVVGFVQFGEDNLKKALSTVGPVSVSIYASLDSFRHYHSGVYYDKRCRNTSHNHAVLAVGYGTDEQSRDYWIVKNSWADTWGEKGYIKMARNRNNLCCIACKPSYAIV